MRGISSDPISPVQAVSLSDAAPVRGVSFVVTTITRASGLMEGSADGVATTTASIVGTGALSGTAAGVATTTAAIVAGDTLEGSAAGVATTTATGQATYSAATIVSILGSRLHFFYEVGVSTETLNGSNYSQLNDYGPGGYHAVQATAGNQPSKATAGGPNGKDCITFQDTARYLLNNSIALSSNRALTFYQITQAVASTQRTQFSVRGADGATGANPPFAVFSSATNFQALSFVHGGSLENIVLTSPALDATWRKWKQRYATGVVPVVTSNGSAVAPLPTFSASGKCAAVGAVQIGGSGVSGGGSFYAAFCVEDLSTDEEAMIDGYITQQTGLS